MPRLRNTPLTTRLLIASCTRNASVQDFVTDLPPTSTTAIASSTTPTACRLDHGSPHDIAPALGLIHVKSALCHVNAGLSCADETFVVATPAYDRVKVKIASRTSSGPLLITGKTTRSSMVPATAALSTAASVIAPVATPFANVAVIVNTFVRAVCP